MKANLKLPARKGWFDPCGEWIGSGYDAEWNSALDEVSRLNQEQPSPAPELVEITQEHGHVVPRADGVKARCGGPAVCKVCQAEQDKTSTLMLLSMTREERDAARARVAELETDLADACASAQREELRANGYSHRLAELEKQVPDGYVQSLPLKDRQPCKPSEDRENGYTIPVYSRPFAVEDALCKLRAVLCDPVGNVVIEGSDGDREEVQRALGMLAAAPAQGE